MSTSPLFEQIVTFFRQDGWFFQIIEGRQLLQTQFKGNHEQWICFAEVKNESEQFRFYSMCPAAVPEERRKAVSEFLTRANFGLAIGNFELNFADGETRFKTSFFFEDVSPTTAMFKHLVYSNVSIMNKYIGGLLKMIYTEADPQATIAEIEGS